MNSRSATHSPLGRSLRISTYIHVGALLFWIIKGWVFPSEPKFLAPSLQVDLVALPDTLKKDLTSLTPPAGEPTEATPPTAPAPAPAPADRVETPVASPNELVLHPKKSKNNQHTKKEKNHHDKSKDREKRIHGALARIKALNKITGSERSSPHAAQPLAGNQISKGTSRSGDARESASAGYDQALRDRLIENWALPVWLSRQNLSARVQLFLDGRGNVRNFKFLKRSGSEQFDLAVRKTIEESQPFPPPPEEIRSWIQSEGVTLGFPL